MRILENIPVASAVTDEFRDTSWRGLFFTGLFFGFVALYILLPKGPSIAWGAAFIPAALSFVLLALAIRSYALSRTHWFVRCSNEALHINVGYLEGYRTRVGTPSILEIGIGEVHALRPVEEVVSLPHRFGITRHHLSSIDIVLKHPIPEEVLKKIFDFQLRFRQAGKSGPYPIRFIHASRLRLGWAWMSPNAVESVTKLSTIFPTQPLQRYVYTNWDRLTGEEQDLFLDELWRMGMIRESLFLGRMRYGLSLRDVSSTLEKRNGFETVLQSLSIK